MDKKGLIDELVKLANDLILSNEVKEEKKASSKIAMKSLFYEIVDYKDVIKLKGRVDEQTYKLAIQVAVKLSKEFTPTNNQEEAINRLKSSTSRHGWDSQLHRNNIFKAAHALGIKLPSMSF